MLTVHDIESLLRLFSYLMLAFPITHVLNTVLTSRFNHKHFMKWMEAYGEREWRVRKAWSDRKIRQLTEERDQLAAELERTKVHAAIMLREP